jgi:hypothetical protein
MLINEQEFLDFRYEVQSQEYSKGLSVRKSGKHSNENMEETRQESDMI